MDSAAKRWRTQSSGAAAVSALTVGVYTLCGVRFVGAVRGCPARLARLAHTRWGLGRSQQTLRVKNAGRVKLPLELARNPLQRCG